MNLINLLEILKNTKEPKAQMDIFRDNGQVLIQIYKQRDVLTWGLDIKLEDAEGIVIEILFNKAKINNNANYLRFINSEFYTNFTKIDNEKHDIWFAVFSSKWQTKELFDFIINLIDDVYRLKNSEIKFTLNAY